jgi:hypothetical protein
VASDYKADLASVDFQTNVCKNLTPFLIIEWNIYTSSSYCFLSVAFAKTWIKFSFRNKRLYYYIYWW